MFTLEILGIRRIRRILAQSSIHILKAYKLLYQKWYLSQDVRNGRIHMHHNDKLHMTDVKMCSEVYAICVKILIYSTRSYKFCDEYTGCTGRHFEVHVVMMKYVWL